MHNAPSVSYPVGRSRFAAWLAGFLWLAGLGVLVLWLLPPAAPGWRQALAAALVLLSGAVVVRGWFNMPQGELSWDGQYWAWASEGACRQGTVTVHLDMQHRLLLRFQGAGGAAQWLWPERKKQSARWDDLRRAVYSRARMARAPAA